MSAESVFSPVWYRVAALKPRLRGHVVTQRRLIGDQPWFLLTDRSSGRVHRVNRSAWEIIGMLDGTVSVGDIWQRAVKRLREQAPTQSEVVQLLQQLHEMHLTQCELTPDSIQLFSQAEQRQRRKRVGALNPLALKVPLFDPSRLLNWLSPKARPLFSRFCLLLWAATVAIALAGALVDWNLISTHAGRWLSTPRYLLLAWLLYPLIKAIHELSHGLAVHRFGGEVREAGVTLMMIVPVPYVDASAANELPSRRARVLIGAIGVIAELGLAALGFFVWSATQPGWLHDAAFVVAFIGSVSTVLFNANPLMRFDGYFVLADALEQPNLAQRANALLPNLIGRSLLGARMLPIGTDSRRECVGLLLYAIASGCYRILVCVLIVSWVASQWLPGGVVLGLWLIATMFARPITRGLEFLLRSPALDGVRVRALAVSAALAGALGVTLLGVPLPAASSALGVVWVPEQAIVRAGGNGFITALAAKPAQLVQRGQPLLQLEDIELESDLQAAREREANLDALMFDTMTKNPQLAAGAQAQLDAARAEVARLDARLAQLRSNADATGIFTLRSAGDLIGRYVERGETLGYLVKPDSMTIRIAVHQDDVEFIRGQTEAVEVRLHDDPTHVYAGKLTGSTPAAIDNLPSAALGDRAGGPWPTDPSDPDGKKVIAPVFLVDVEVPGLPTKRIGARASVRFVHAPRTIGERVWRRMQQAFLRNVDVNSR